MPPAEIYDATDPRSRLTPAPDGVPPQPPGPAEYAALGDDGIVRGQNFVLHHVTGEAGEAVRRDDQLDEYVLLVADSGTCVRVRVGGDEVRIDRPSLVVVPPGASEVVFDTPGRIIRVLTVASAPDLAERSANAAGYRSPKANVAAYVAWPEASAGPAVRVCDLAVPDEAGRFGRIWRCSTFMVNVLPPQSGQRDPHRLSPHTHADFEQCSLALQGTFVHHLRWPWGSDRTRWRDDLHLEAPAPSAVVIPPPVVHTTEATGHGTNLLVDIFCPPRSDFALVEGWVLNHDDYPMP